jgi:hypothetical protein
MTEIVLPYDCVVSDLQGNPPVGIRLFVEIRNGGSWVEVRQLTRLHAGDIVRFGMINTTAHPITIPTAEVTARIDPI